MAAHPASLGRSIGCVILGLVAAGAAWAGPVPIGPATPSARSGLRVDLRLGSLYNSNLALYSDRDQTAFLNREPASRFAIRSIDDAAFRGSGSLALTAKLIGGRFSRLGYTYTRSSYSRNPIKDSESHRFAFRQPFARKAWAELAFAHTPEFYLRHLWDADLRSPYQSYPHYQAARLATREFQLGAGFRPRPLWTISAGLDRGTLDYNAAFRERNTREWQAEATAALGPEGGMSMSLTPGFSRRSAKATDPSHPEIPDSLRSDTSSRELSLALGGSIPEHTIRWVPFEVRASVRASRRTFTTGRTLDLSHFGRKDANWAASLNLERSLMRSVSWYGMVRWERQTSSGAAAANGTEEAAAYRQVVAGGGLHFGWSGRM